MLLFEPVPADDDLTVLSAYAQAQQIAEAARKAQRHDESALSPSPEPDEDLVAFDAETSGQAGDDADADEPRNSKSAPRRAETWVSRLREIDGISADRMAPIHGRLIAHGLLQFQLHGSEEGVRYRVSAAGRQALNTPDADAA